MQKTVLLYLALLFGFAAPSWAQLKLSIDTYVEDQGNQIAIPLKVENFTDLFTVQFAFGWDPSVLKYVSSVEPELVGWDANTYNDNTADDGYVRVAWTELSLVGDSMEDGASFLTLTFEVIGEPGDSTFLAFQDTILPTQYGDINDTTPQVPTTEEGQLNVFLDVGIADRPEDFGWKIEPCSPNPFSGQAIIAFSNPQATDVKWSIYDLTGKLITTKYKAYSAGVNHFVLEQHLLTSNGTYFIKLETPEFISTQKIEFFR